MSRSCRLLIAGLVLLASRPAAAAIPECTAAILKAAAPDGMTIADIPNAVSGATGTSASPVKTVVGIADIPVKSLAPDAPAYCYVTGTVVTNPRTGKTANFAAALPARATWNGKFMFQGCGGNCGVVNPPMVSALRKGYPVWVTDDGHVAQPSPAARLWRASDTSWAVVEPGKRDEDAMTDFYHRAVHVVTEAGKKFTRAYYGGEKLSYSYYQGCSDGGREGMVAVSRYPDDFDGTIAGAPYFDIANEIVSTLVGVHAQMRSPGAAVPPKLFALADRLITAKCDAIDGVKDGLIQDPARCTFNPQRDLPRCRAGSTSEIECFTDEQVDSLSIMLSATTNPAGRAVYTGFSVSNLYDADSATTGINLLADWLGFPVPPHALQDAQPWSHDPPAQPLSWFWVKQTIANFVYQGANDFNALKTPGITFRRDPHTDAPHAVIPDKTIALLAAKVRAGSGVNPADAAAFIGRRHKLIMYHGYSDGDITPFRTVQYYRQLAGLHGGYTELQRNVRLFMVPGMAHCRGGPGPNVFGQPFVAPAMSDPQHDIVAALESWVEKGEPPTQIVATKYERDDPTKAVVRTMPLCPFPAMATYRGHGDVNDAASWSCSVTDHRLEEHGPVGERAGAYAPLPN